jgi:hypothetical protein
MPLKKIIVENCRTCPFHEDNDGGGYIEPYHQCTKFDITLTDQYKSFDLDKIHPKCRLLNN